MEMFDTSKNLTAVSPPDRIIPENWFSRSAIHFWAVMASLSAMTSSFPGMTFSDEVTQLSQLEIA
jgi:hypothetical protein